MDKLNWCVIGFVIFCIGFIVCMGLADRELEKEHRFKLHEINTAKDIDMERWVA